MFANSVIFDKNSIYAYFYVDVQNLVEDLTIRSRIIAYFGFSKWRLSAILYLVWRHRGRPTTCVWWS